MPTRAYPIVTEIVTDVLVIPPDVLMLESANLVLPLHSLTMLTRASSTSVTIASTRSASCFACASVNFSRVGQPSASPERHDVRLVLRIVTF
jgi:hypothetical protein